MEIVGCLLKARLKILKDNAKQKKGRNMSDRAVNEVLTLIANSICCLKTARNDPDAADAQILQSIEWLLLATDKLAKLL